jgi:hypothetical protein
MADLDQIRDRLAADPLRRRVGGDELRMLGLDRPQLVKEGVVDVVADLGIVEDVVPVAVVLELLAQLVGASRRIRFGATYDSLTSSAAGAISRARS